MLPSLLDGTEYNSVYVHLVHVTEVKRLFCISKIFVRKVLVVRTSPTSQSLFPHFGQVYLKGLSVFIFYGYFFIIFPSARFAESLIDDILDLPVSAPELIRSPLLDSFQLLRVNP